MDRAGEPVDRLGGLDQLPRLLLRRLPRIGELRDHRLVLVERFDRRLVGNRDEDHVASFLGFADVPHHDAVGRLVERGEVSVDVGHVRQLAGRSRHVSEQLQRRGHGGGRGQVIDELRRDPRVLQVLPDLCGVLRVVWLRVLRGAGLRGGTASRGGGEHQRDGQPRDVLRAGHKILLYRPASAGSGVGGRTVHQNGWGCSSGLSRSPGTLAATVGLWTAGDLLSGPPCWDTCTFH